MTPVGAADESKPFTADVRLNGVNRLFGVYRKLFLNCLLNFTKEAALDGNDSSLPEHVTKSRI